MGDAPALAGDLDAACLLTRDHEAVLRALGEACAEEGLVPADPSDLPAYGTFRHGEEHPTVRRFLVSPPSGRWTVVLLSAQDWDHDWLPRLASRLRCPAASLMLADGDVFALHLYDETGAEIGALVTSPAYFDLPEAEPDPRLGPALARLAGRRSLAPGELEATCLPPGPIDVAGDVAFARTAELLGLPGFVAGSYGRALAPDRREPAASHEAWSHVAFRREEPELPDGDDSGDEARRASPEPPTVLRFRRPER